MNASFLRSGIRSSATLFLLALPTWAQSVLPATNSPSTAPLAEQRVELSPFVISESAETGWVATETLAGSRLRTNFKDVPNQIETLTKDFMADLGVTSVEQALVYTANVENLNDYVPFVPGSAAADPGQSGRVRGIGGGTRSRNFFQAQNPTDNYNIDRVTVASGPNAILFGLGSPAGILDTTPARAIMRNKYGFTLQFDSENSKRATFDANHVILKDRLAIRLMGLSKREQTEKKPNLDRDERIYGALTFQPFKNTTLILQGERDSRNWNRAVRQPPADFVSLWHRADQIPGSGYTTARPIYDNTSFTNIATNLIFNRAGNVPVLTNDGQPMRSWNNSVTVRNPSTSPAPTKPTTVMCRMSPIRTSIRSRRTCPARAARRSSAALQRMRFWSRNWRRISSSSWATTTRAPTITGSTRWAAARAISCNSTSTPIAICPGRPPPIRMSASSITRAQRRISRISTSAKTGARRSRMNSMPAASSASATAF
jgi:outer membrane receptor protein involved in Fe transport